MSWRNYRFGCSIIAIALVALMTGCGGSSNTTMVVTLTPGSAAVLAGQTVQFSVSGTGVSAGSVTWSVDGVPGGSAATGTVTSAGLYTAPTVSAPASFTVGVVSNANFSLGAAATVSVLLTGQVSSTKNPQVAQYSIMAPAGSQVQIQFGPDTNYGLETWSVSAPSGGGSVSILVAGMKGFTTYHMRAAVQLSASTQFLDSDHTFTTGGLTAAQTPVITTTTATGMTPNPGIELLDLLTLSATGTQENVAATDLAGNVIWFFDPGYPANTIPNPVKLLPNGNILINYDSGVVDGTGSILQEVDLAGNTVFQLTAADLNQALAAAGFNLTVVGSHHDFAVLPNGHLILICGENKTFTNLVGFPGATTIEGDVLIDLDTNLKPVWTWSEFDHLDVNRHQLSFPPDWTHSNAVLYSPDDGDLILSIRHQSWVLKIDYDNGKGAGDIVWKLGYQGDFKLQGGTDPADWFYAQHAPYIASANSSGVFSLGLFDNGNNALNSSGVGCGILLTSPCQSRVQIFQLDETAKTATITFQDKLPIFSVFGGYVETLANGNIEFDECASNFFATTADVFEVTDSTSPQTIWQMHIAGQFAYRAFRIPSLYPGVQW
ncbi:MAG TPA: aryl-sulfate sulfotransferase [Terriglobia bacterium]|nr:aryl-sulfate sulfotransferase [Terriglobia bacterium]